MIESLSDIDRLLVKTDWLFLRYFFFPRQRFWFNIYNIFKRHKCSIIIFMCVCVCVFVIHLTLWLLSSESLVVQNVMIR
jgi:hypothetical protein